MRSHDRFYALVVVPIENCKKSGFSSRVFSEYDFHSRGFDARSRTAFWRFSDVANDQSGTLWHGRCGARKIPRGG
jgi:hypothetical protein